MRKIASPQDLQLELHRLMTACQKQPSRIALAAQLRALADRVAGRPLQVDVMEPLPFEGVVHFWWDETDKEYGFRVKEGQSPFEVVDNWLKRNKGGKLMPLHGNKVKVVVKDPYSGRTTDNEQELEVFAV